MVFMWHVTGRRNIDGLGKVPGVILPQHNFFVEALVMPNNSAILVSPSLRSACVQ